MAHILIVEDEEHLGVGIKYNLEAEGYRVTLAKDGPTALRLIEADATSFDLVILDLMLPGMSGYAVCETIRDWGLFLPVLMLSARTLPEDRSRGFDVGANQYLSKPFELDELLSRVKNLLQMARRNGQAAAPPAHTPRRDASLTTAEFGAVRIDFRSHEVFVSGQRQRMTSRELRLLQYFVENEGRVISRRELLTQVWQLPGDVQTRSIDQFIARLRKAIEPDPAKPQFLLTVRDAGYRFVCQPDAGASGGA